MEKRIHLYVRRKDPALWLSGLLMLALAAYGANAFGGDTFARLFTDCRIHHYAVRPQGTYRR